MQGLFFDSRGRLWASEFGNSERDEVNLISAGKNYGWPECEGRCGRGGFVDPVQEWPVAQASPSGLCIVRDTIFIASLRGTRLWRMEIDGSDVSDVKAFLVGTYGAPPHRHTGSGREYLDDHEQHRQQRPATLGRRPDSPHRTRVAVMVCGRLMG